MPRGAAAGHALSHDARAAPSVDWGRLSGGPSEAGRRSMLGGERSGGLRVLWCLNL